ncbi:MAG TPA: NAD-dependent epimerase/dehydratase family protein [Candidatus Binataceae bacterium]|nr:NAD-dependent epimerase/dehydratase family protein [Candidatus Binataceae bacterium]
MRVIITGGAGFIGSNAAARYLERGDEVVIVDNLARAGTRENLRWLRERGSPKFHAADLRDAEAIDGIFRDFRDASIVLHLGGQVAVTSSVADPRFDFEVNALGTLNVLEAMRRNRMEGLLIYASTNKVYGQMKQFEVVESETRYEYAAMPHGVSEHSQVDFHSPYGCSKGAADQYVADYHRVFGLNTVVFRQSCIYGARQFGVEDQGWVAWFLIAAELGHPITLYGDGKQVRDVLYVEDLLDAFDAACANIEAASGRVYNIGGGPTNAISLLDLIDHVGHIRGQQLKYVNRDWRPGDQRIYVSDIRRARSELRWEPQVPWRAGVERLSSWVAGNRLELETAVAKVSRVQIARRA